MHQTDQYPELIVLEKIKSFFLRPFKGKAKPICVGDLGVYQDVLTVNTSKNNDTHSIFHDIYIKVKAVAIYENLVEIEVINVSTLNTCNQEVEGIINSNIPKYINPKYIQWEIKP